MIAAIRVRGCVNLNHDIKRALAQLNLNRVNRLNIVPDTKENRKMVKKTENYITWGEIDAELIARILAKRGRVSISKKLSVEYLKEKKISSFKELAEKIEAGASPQSFGLKPFFGLKPPSKGYDRKGIKKSFSIGGALGYRGKEISKLINRMI